MEEDYTDAVAELESMSEEEFKDVVFNSIMNLLKKAVKAEDIEMMKSYARLATEMYFDDEEEELTNVREWELNNDQPSREG